MNKKDNATSQKEYNHTSILDCKEKPVDEIPEKEFKGSVVRVLKTQRSNWMTTRNL